MLYSTAWKANVLGWVNTYRVRVWGDRCSP